MFSDISQTRRDINCTAQIDPRVQHLISSNTTALSKEECVLLDKYLTEEPCYEFLPKFRGGRPIPYSILFRTLAMAFDWLINVWVHGSGRQLVFPPNSYGLEIRAGYIRRLRDRPLPLHAVTFMLDSIAFWMREEMKFSEMDAVIANKGMIFAILTVRLSPGTISSNSSGHGSEDPYSKAIWNSSAISGQGHSNEFWESGNTGSPAPNMSDTSVRGPFVTAVQSDITKAGSLGQAISTELDLMSNLITIARTAVELGRARELYSYIPPDHTCTTVEPARGLREVEAEEVAESLLRLIEWEYQQLTQTGSFFCAQLRTRRMVSRSWKPKHTISVSWIQSGHTATSANFATS